LTLSLLSAAWLAFGDSHVVLIGRIDPLTDPPEKRKPFIALSHPGYERADEAIRIALTASFGP